VRPSDAGALVRLFLSLLVWTLELGKQDSEDVESRSRFMNAECLMSRFKALKRFKERDTDAR
jgi:hypothetical protein